MQQDKRILSISVTIVLVTLVLFFSGCASNNRLTGKGNPIEPIAPGSDNGEAQALQGGFSVRSSDVQIRDMDVTRSGSQTLVATASRGIYLLEGDGNLRWELGLNSDPLVTYMDPEGRYLAVGTAGGKFQMMYPDQSDRVTKEFARPVDLISVSEDGETILVRNSNHTTEASEESEEQDALVLFDKQQDIRWEQSFPRVLDAKIAGEYVFVNWLEDDEPILGMFDIDGEQIWERRERNLMTLDTDGTTLISVSDNEVFRYNRRGAEIWSYTAKGTVARVIVADDGSHLAVVVIDEATQNEQLHYLTAAGEKLWDMRLPDESDVLLSPNGSQIIVSSWRQYRDDSTQVIIYNERGQEMNTLGVAGRAQKMVLADRTSILVLGLGDGRIYYLNVRDRSTQGSDMISEELEKGLGHYYIPVSYERAAGESLISLFFFDDMAQNLIPVTRRVERTSSLLRSSIDELIRGPVRGSLLNRTIPKDADIQVVFENGIVQLDLPKELDEMAGTTNLTGILDSLLLTVSQFPTVEKIQYTVAGQEQETFGQEGLLIDELYTPRRFGRLDGERQIFVPTQSGNRYYLRSTTREFLPLKDSALIETLVRYVLAESGPFFSYNLELRSVTVENNIVKIDLSESFNQHLENNAESAAKAAMLRDAIGLTLAESHYPQIEITVNGSSPRTSELYLPWSMVVSRPYFVNMEE